MLLCYLYITVIVRYVNEEIKRINGHSELFQVAIVLWIKELPKYLYQ